MMSVPLPGVNGTMIFTGLAGQACPRAVGAVTVSNNAHTLTRCPTIATQLTARCLMVGNTLIDRSIMWLLIYFYWK
jgi:hypothetical protein